MSEPQREPSKIMVVDDTKANLTAMRVLLKSIDADIVTVNSGNEALVQAFDNDFAIILLDVQMPEMDGYEVAQLLREEESTKDIPIIFVTAVYRDEEHKLMAYSAGGIDFIEKPIIKEILLAKVRTFIDLYDNKKELEIAINRAKDYAKELEHVNNNLESIVAERTKKLQMSLENLQAAQEQMIESEKMASLGGLVAGVAHEINTPVGSCLMGITHLQEINSSLKVLYQEQRISKKYFDGYLDTSEQLSDAIQINLQRIIALIESFKQVAVDQSINEVCEFSLAEKINHVILSLSSRFNKTAIKVKVNCDENLTVKCDPGMLIQVFTNLISNSLFHGFDQGDEGCITISAVKKSDKTHIIYQDNGKGVAKEVLPKIFDSFFTTKRGQGGTGLGMHIIYNIVHSGLGGSIKVKSDEGSGVEFEIIF